MPPRFATLRRFRFNLPQRVAAGLLVLLGVLLAWLVHPIFFALTTFIGAGLVFAGITDTCGMGLLLVRMPWNQMGVTSVPQMCKLCFIRGLCQTQG